MDALDWSLSIFNCWISNKKINNFDPMSSLQTELHGDPEQLSAETGDKEQKLQSDSSERVSQVWLQRRTLLRSQSSELVSPDSRGYKYDLDPYELDRTPTVSAQLALHNNPGAAKRKDGERGKEGGG